MSVRPIPQPCWRRAAAGAVLAGLCLTLFVHGDEPKKPLSKAWTFDEATVQFMLHPSDPYIQYVVLQLGKREHREAEANRLIDGQMNGVVPFEGRGRLAQADLFSTFTGALAIQESLQLDTMRGQQPGRPAPRGQAGILPPNARPNAPPPIPPDKVRVDSIRAPANQSHPWKQMLGDKKPDTGVLANCVPADFWFAEFRSVARLHEVTSASELWGGHFFTQVLGDAHSTETVARIKKQLGLFQLPQKAVEALEIDGVALTGSDLFFGEGSDVTLLVHSRKLNQLLQLIDPLLQSIGKSEAGEDLGIAYTHRFSADGTLNVYSANPKPDLHVRSNSLPAFKRVLEAFGNIEGQLAPRLGETDEFKYMRTLMAPGAAEEDGFVYLSDPFIHHMVGPQLKLTERRRVLVYNHLRMIGHAALLFRTEFGRAPKSLEELAETKCAPGVFGKGELAHPDGGTYSLSEDGMSGVCSVYGRAESLAPCIEHPAAEVTGSEADDYRAFLRAYSQYWRTYFDPIALRIQATPKQVRLETLILPLIDNSVYTGLASAFGGAPAVLNPLPTPKHEIGGVWVHFDKKQLLDILGPERVVKAESKRNSVKNVTQAENDLKQLALAMLNYESAFASYPPAAIRDANGKPLLSWRVAILPFIEQQNLYSQFHLNEPWDSEHNKQLIARMPPLYISGNAKLAAEGKTVYVAPVGKNTIFEPDGKKVRILDITDGTSNTILLVEAADDHAAIWTKPDDLEFDADKPLNGLGRSGADYFLVVMADGSARKISTKLKPEMLAAAFTRNDGQPVILDDAPTEPETGPKSAFTMADNLRMVALAMHNYASANTYLPRQAIVGKDGKPLLSWRVELLPYLDEQNLYSQFHLDEPWDSEHNKKLISRMPHIYAGSNKKLNDEGKTPFVVPLSEPGMNETLFNTKLDKRSLEQITSADGTANTIMGVLADDDHCALWTKPEDLMIDLEHPFAGLLRDDRDDPIVLFADGAVRVLGPNVDAKSLAAMFTWKAGDVIGVPPGDLRDVARPWNWDLWPSKADLEQLESIGFDLNKLRRLLKDGIGDEVGFQIHDASKMLDFDTGGAIGAGGNAFGLGDSAAIGIGPLVQFLTSPSTVTVPVRNPAVVDAFLDEYDQFLTIRKGPGDFVPLRFAEFYKFPLAGRYTVRCIAIKFAGLKLRFFWARIGNGLYMVNRPFLLDDIAAAQADVRPKPSGLEPAHALLQVRPENFHEVLPGYRLGWEENQRGACQKNLSMLASVARGWDDRQPNNAPSPTLLDRVQRIYGTRPFCPDGGIYTLSPDSKECRCSIHSDVHDPRQLLAPADSSLAGRAFRSFAGFHATLTFTKEGLRATAVLDRKE